ncbi:fibronectin type III domain-containing protein [Actinomadura macrotermitis]|uniref:Fibronectin type-III domain-containing protein n=1 Tax=Actinomadura macrotermitis TaxID=2585200 RepID=A0A7K0BUA0_9ACTN|nr:fibronectin type III domain-containing protein [Actinomadura macrotermitis]MQY04783.1 hypothetical protein [Actinomadura macrotermitis]
MNIKSKSGKIRLALATAAAGGMVAGMLGAVAGPASADPVNLTLKYTCGFPLLGDETVVAKIKSDVPTTIPVNTATPKIVVDVVSTQTAKTYSALNIAGVATLEGSARADATVLAPQGDVAVGVPVKLDKTALPPSDTPIPFDMHGSGTAPSLKFSKAGHAKINVGALMLNITPRDSDGAEVTLDDPDYDIHKVACKIQPGQNVTLAEFDITPPGGGGVAPPAPGKPSGTTTENSATLTWGPSVDPDGDLAGYDVYDAAGKVVASTDDKTTTATIAGLSPDKDYTYTVKAKDKAAHVSPASEAVTVHTKPGKPEGTAPTKPGKPSGTTTEDSATLTWGASTDADGDLAGYDVYDAAGKVVASTDAKTTTATISGLDADKDYTYTVKAKDKAAHVSDASDAVTVHTKPKAPVDHPPTKPGTPSGTTTENAATLTWGASTDPDGDLAGYDVLDASGKVVASTDAKTTTATIPGLDADKDYTFTVKAKDAKGNTSDASAPVTVHTKPGKPEGTAPTKPGKPSGTTTEDSATLTWGASTDADGDLAGYDVYDAAGKVVASTDAKTTTATISGLDADKDYTFTVKAKDKEGHVSDASDAGTVHTKPKAPADHAPTTPANGSSTTTKDSATLKWDASTDEDGDLAGYDVYDAAGKVVASTDAKTTTATVTGLDADKDYTFTVKAKDAKGNKSEALSITAHTQKGGDGGPINYGYTLKGSTFVKAPNGTAPLNGTVDASLDALTGNFTADLAFQPTKGDFKILGFLPVQAGIVLEPLGKTTGTLKSNTLTTNSKVNVKLPSFTLFGIPLGGGEKCQTVKPSDIKLSSAAGGFQALKGGQIKGEYELSAIKDCNLLTPILSVFTQGKGNTIDVTLTPKPKK